ncbi:MAG: class I SAM-dependent methyltransferase [Anaerolineae bacterium]
MRFLRRAVTLPSKAAYALWAAEYPPHAHNPLMALEETAVRSLLPPLTSRRVLDLAGGTGRYAQMAYQRGAAMVISTDNSLAMLRENASPLRAEADMRGLPFADATFEVILCGLAIGHLPSESLVGFYREMQRVLCADGVALISDFHPFLYFLGGRREFTIRKRRYAVEHHPHLLSSHFAALEAANLRLTGLSEPTAPLPNRPDQDVPAVLVLQVTKP